MTDAAQTMNTGVAGAASRHTTDSARKRLSKRYASELRFKLIGLSAVLVSGMFLVILMSTIVGQALPAFTYHYITVPVDMSAQNLGIESEPSEDDLRGINYRSIIRDGIQSTLPFVEGRTNTRALNGLLSSGAGVILQGDVMDNPDEYIGRDSVSLLLDDTADLYLKGLVTDLKTIDVNGIASPTGTEGTIRILSTSNDFIPVLDEVKQNLRDQASDVDREIENQTRSLVFSQDQAQQFRNALADNPGEDRADFERLLAEAEENVSAQEAIITQLQEEAQSLRNRANATGEEELLTRNLPSMFVAINGGVVKATRISSTEIEGEVYVPLQSTADASPENWDILEIERPEATRKIDDRAIIYLEQLKAQDRIERKFNSVFFTKGASREAEMAGVWGAVVGSILTMTVTLLLSFPLGVSAAIYLEEFAPKNRWTHLIEVNINNLAAVPSIVFGLLGLAVFLNVFGFPRSAPIAGGMVIALMTLPTIIIASRAALKAVPPSIREGAYGIGASKLQTVFHHVLPLAMPGILTGTIIGMAQALGETAPLLMIGMVAFIVDIPSGFLSPATVLPVQIYMWADFPEIGFQQKTAAAILVLLTFLVTMNALAIVLRKRFERRW
jgi:phosphate transport system permease protein